MMKRESIWNKQISLKWNWKRGPKPKPESKQKPTKQKREQEWNSNWNTMWNRRKRSSVYLGLELTDRHLKLCELETDGSEVRAVYCTEVELPEGTMSDGRMMNQEALEQALGKLLLHYPWSGRQVHFAIPSQMVMMKTLKLPDLPDKQLEKLLSYELTQTVSLPFESPHYDYYRVGTVEADEEAAAADEMNNAASPTKLCEVAVIAAPMALLEQYIGILTRAGLQPASFEVKSFSLARLTSIGMNGGFDGGSCILMDVNAVNCELTLVDEGVIRITRNVEIQFERPKSENQQLGGLFAVGGLMDAEHHFDNACQDIIAELERLLNFYRYKLNRRNREFDRLVVSGSLERMDHLLEALSSRMSRQVVQAGWGMLKVSDQREAVNVSAYAVPIGLALRGRNG